MTLKENCTHPPYAVQDGPRGPLAHGRAPTQVCTLCGATRSTLSAQSAWKPATTKEAQK